MKIAFIGQKNIEEVTSRMEKKGHEIFVFSDFSESLRAMFCQYDVIHYHGNAPKFFSWILKTFKWRTTVVNFPIPIGTNVKYSDQLDSISEWKLKDKKYILSVGRLMKHRGINYLIEAFKLLEDMGQTPNNFKLVIVGDENRSPEYVKYLQTISQGRQNIIFTGMQTGEVLQQLFSHAYLFVQPSETKETSVALLEAMMYGLAPLVSDTKENVKFVGENGFYFPSKSTQDLKDKLAYLLARNDVVEEYGKLAKEKADREYGWDSITQNILDIYTQLIYVRHKKKDERSIPEKI